MRAAPGEGGFAPALLITVSDRTTYPGHGAVIYEELSPRSACLLPRANALENGTIALKHRESERKVSG